MFGHRLFYFIGFVYWYIIQYQKYLFYTGIIFLINPVDKIQELLSGFMFVGVCPHLVICIIIDTKYI